MAHRRIRRLARLVAAQAARRQREARVSQARGRVLYKLYRAACFANGLSSVEVQQLRALEAQELVELGSDGRIYLTAAGFGRLL